MKKLYSHIKKYDAYRNFREMSLKELNENKAWTNKNIERVTKFFLNLAVNHVHDMFMLVRELQENNMSLNNEIGVLIRQIIMASEVRQKDEVWSIIWEAKRIAGLVVVDCESGMWMEGCSLKDLKKILKAPETVAGEGAIAEEIEKILSSMMVVKDTCQDILIKYGIVSLEAEARFHILSKLVEKYKTLYIDVESTKTYMMGRALRTGRREVANLISTIWKRHEGEESLLIKSIDNCDVFSLNWLIDSGASLWLNKYKCHAYNYVKDKNIHLVDQIFKRFEMDFEKENLKKLSSLVGSRENNLRNKAL